MTTNRVQQNCTRATWKPRVTAEDIPSSKTRPPQTTFVGISGATVRVSNRHRPHLVAELPYAHLEPSVKDARPKRMELIDEKADLSRRNFHDLSHRWRGSTTTAFCFRGRHCPRRAIRAFLVALKTFTGMQMK